MLYTCPCDQRIINIEPWKLLSLSESDIQYECTAGTGFEISNPFYGSHLGAKGIELTRRQEEIEEEDEYEEEDTDVNCDLNLPPGFFEE